LPKGFRFEAVENLDCLKELLSLEPNKAKLKKVSLDVQESGEIV